MMIIKIFPSSSGFPAIAYNDRKILQGKCELLETGNFEGLGHVRQEIVRSDYINYMTMVAGLNSRVRNRQFHAVISARERTRTPEALKRIAVRYLDKMGFGKNPYLIYAHTDTENTHVHMVSSWVGKQGKRVSDTYGWLRSQEAIHEILRQSPGQEARQAIAKALGYNFSSMAQFSLLLARQGFKTRDNPRGLEVIKYGRVVGIFEKKQVWEKIGAYVSPENRVSQLKELFYTFMPGLNLKGFAGFVEKQFGLDVILHPWKKRGLSGDYTIIDHGVGYVFRGDQVMPVAALQSVVTREEKLAKVKKCVLEMTGENTPFSTLRKEIPALGFEISREGSIRVKGTTGPSLQITQNLLNRLQYNDRVVSAAAYAVGGSREAELLARLFMVRPYDLALSERKVNPEKYHALFTPVDHRKPEDVLASRNIQLIKYAGNFFLIDEKERAVVALDKEKAANTGLHHMGMPDLERKRHLVQKSLEFFDYQGADTLTKVIDGVSQSIPGETRKITLSL